MAIVRTKLSASTNGQSILLATSTPTTIHASTTAANTSDEVHIWLISNNASLTTVSIFMGTTGSVNEIKIVMPSFAGPYLCVPGLYMVSGVISALAQGASIAAYGFVNRLTTGA